MREREYQNLTYIEGNAVRRIDVMPDDWEREQSERKKREELEQKRRRKRARARAIAYRNQQRELIMDRGYVLFLTFAAIITCLTAILYIKLQTDVTNHLNNIAVLETSVNELKSTNDATDKRIHTTIQMNTVVDEAMNTLGMHYPNQQQIVTYTIDHADFMTQYSKIP